MKISTKGHYAVQALVDIVLQEAIGPVSLADIAQRQNLSQNYLEQLFVKLRKAELVKSVRGPGGGYLVSRPPEDVTIGQIFEAVDENIALTDCAHIDGASQDICSLSNDCKTQALWSMLCQHFNDLLYSISLADVINGDFHLPETSTVARPLRAR